MKTKTYSKKQTKKKSNVNKIRQYTKEAVSVYGQVLRKLAYH